MAKHFWIQWFPREHLADTRVLSLAAKGAWSDLLNVMISQNVGSLTMPWVGYSRLLGVTVGEAISVIGELVSLGICDAQVKGRPLGVTDCGENVTENVTIISRRLMRKLNSRNSGVKRTQKWREKKEEQARDVSVTGKLIN